MVKRLFKDSKGAAAAEMALVAPLLLLLMFGAMELGYYFYSEHVVIKAVRDGARFASRQGFANFTCTSGGDGTVNSTTEAETQRVTRTDQVATGGTPRLANWTNDNSVTVRLSCVDNSGGTYGSFYEDYKDTTGTAAVPVVTVSASVTYTPLFSLIGFSSAALQLKADSQAAVVGV